MTKLLVAACVAGLFVCSPALAQISYDGVTPVVRDFQTFAGTGFAPTPTAGQLDSDDFRVTGWSDGSGSFGGTHTAGDFARGASSAAVGTGGTYAFQTGAANVALGMQPGGSDFDPGALEVRYMNAGTTAISSVRLSARFFGRNDQARGSAVTGSYSVNGGPFFAIPTFAAGTATTLDALGWVSSALTADVGLSWPAGTLLIVRFDNVSTGSGTRDEIAFDDITIAPIAPTAALDFGDAPSSYDDPVAASHDITAVNSPRLGLLVDAESGPQSSPAASGDGADDDGVSLVSFTRGSTISIPVFGASPGVGYELIAYFDWDQDGEFDDFEVIDDTITGSFTGSVVVTVPMTAALGTTFARFRIATSLSLDPDGAEADGEVEDYRIGVVAACGDGIVDTGETCDDAGATDTCGCLPDCSGFASASTPCGAAGDACDPADFCNAAGACVVSIAPTGTACRAAADLCDLPEVCNGSPVCPPDLLRSSVALCRPVAAGGCDIAEFCTGASVACPGDSVRPSSFECRATTGACDVAESCNGSTAVCPGDGFAPSGTTCTDGSACTTGDACNAGACVSGGPTACGDGNACTTDACSPATGCTNTAITGCCTSAADCGDGTACTNDVCNLATNTCANTPVSCLPPDSCTTSTCDPDTGCTNVPVVCPDDGNACTNDACMVGIGCTFITANCNDSNACTVDSCSPSTGCANVALSCDDGNVCTADVCNLATGCGSMPIPGCCRSNADCGDSNACTTDTCNTSTNTCTNVALSCDDGNVCTGDVCSPTTGCGTMAIPGCCLTDTDCGDGNACTSDACNVATNTCSNATIDCDDGDVCTSDVCSAGACTHDAEPACFDAGMPDAGTDDAGIDDAGIADDAGTDDAGIADEDAGGDDAGIIDIDAALPDAALPDTGASDVGPSDVGPSDVGPSDGGPLDASPDAGPGVVEMGCGCRVQSDGRSSAWPLVSLVLLALVIARRRR